MPGGNGEGGEGGARRGPTTVEVPARCGRLGCDRPTFFRVELVVIDSEGKHLPLALGLGVCQTCAVDVQREGPGPFLAGEQARALATYAMRRKGYGRPVWDRTQLSLIPILIGGIVVAGSGVRPH